MQTYNNLLIKRMAQTVVHQVWPKDPVDLTWFFFDELVEAGEFEGFHTLLNYGRGKGVRVMLGFCDMAGLEKTFDTHEAVLALCDCKVFFRLGSAKTAEWAANQCGSIPTQVASRGITHDGHVNLHLGTELRNRVEAHEFRDLPLSRGGRLDGFALTDLMPVFQTRVSDVNDYLPPRIAKDDPTRFTCRDEKDQDISSWQLEDYEAMGIDAPKHLNRENDDMPPPQGFRM